MTERSSESSAAVLLLSPTLSPTLSHGGEGGYGLDLFRRDVEDIVRGVEGE